MQADNPIDEKTKERILAALPNLSEERASLSAKFLADMDEESKK